MSLHRSQAWDAHTLICSLVQVQSEVKLSLARAQWCAWVRLLFSIILRLGSLYNSAMPSGCTFWSLTCMARRRGTAGLSHAHWAVQFWLSHVWYGNVVFCTSQSCLLGCTAVVETNLLGSGGEWYPGRGDAVHMAHATGSPPVIPVRDLIWWSSVAVTSKGMFTGSLSTLSPIGTVLPTGSSNNLIVTGVWGQVSCSPTLGQLSLIGPGHAQSC